MLRDTWGQYLSIRLIILVLQNVGPACLGYTIWGVIHRRPAWPIHGTWQTYCAAEALFFLFFLWYRVHLQGKAVHPPLRSREDRQALFHKVRSEIYDPQKFLSGWFRGAKVEDIGRDELKAFLNWAFWDGRAAGAEDEAEIEEYVAKVEKMMPAPFNPGKGKAKALRLTLDPIEMECRTLLWYFIMMLADTFTHVFMKRCGYRYFRTTPTSLRVFPPRPTALVERTYSPANDLSYWLRPHTSQTRPPVLYIHGIGIGLATQVGFLTELKQALDLAPNGKDDGEVGILAIEILQVSMRLTHSVPTREKFLEQITQILDHHGFDRFVLCSHSYGSVLSTHIMRHPSLAKRISATVLIDPVSILLHMPDVAYNFTVRPPKHANEWQLWYFASKDPGVAYTLGRHFFWTENLLWRDRIMELCRNGMHLTVSLASDDLIVDTEAVGMYLTEHALPDPVLKEDDDGRKQLELEVPDGFNSYVENWKHRKWQGRGMEVIWWDGFDHAQVFDRAATRKRLVDVLVEYCKAR